MKLYHPMLYILFILVAACSQQNSENEIVDTEAPFPNGEAFKFAPTDTPARYRKNIFAALAKYEDPKTDINMKRYHLQLLTFAGREDIGYEDKLLTQKKTICVADEKTKSSLFSEGLSKLISGEHSLIIINEDHSFPRDRTFILSLLEELKSEGFTHYAAETFSHENLNSDLNFAEANEGYYLNEPIFGRLITQAKSLGFELVPYEMRFTEPPKADLSMDERIKQREEAQSDNLIEAVLEKAPETKMIIHVGHSHVAEVPLPKGSGEGSRKWMAALLKEKTGIDPLTISQTSCASPDEKIIFADRAQDADGNDTKLMTDYVIGHPELSFTNGRPDWRGYIGDVEVGVPKPFLGLAEPIIIEARNFEDANVAVPIERLLLRPNEKDISLLLPKGKYRIEAFTEVKRLNNTIILEVP